MNNSIDRFVYQEGDKLKIIDPGFKFQREFFINNLDEIRSISMVKQILELGVDLRKHFLDIKKNGAVLLASNDEKIFKPQVYHSRRSASLGICSTFARQNV